MIKRLYQYIKELLTQTSWKAKLFCLRITCNHKNIARGYEVLSQGDSYFILTCQRCYRIITTEPEYNEKIATDKNPKPSNLKTTEPFSKTENTHL